MQRLERDGRRPGVHHGRARPEAELHGRREEERQQWKRDLSGRANGTIDPFYGCFLLDELIDYAVNFTFPWCEDPSPPVFFISTEGADAARV